MNTNSIFSLNLYHWVNIYRYYNYKDSIYTNKTTKHLKIFGGKYSLLVFLHQDTYMKQTRQKHDSFTTIKIPLSLKKKLSIISAHRDEFLYQTIAYLLVQGIEKKHIDFNISDVHF